MLSPKCGAPTKEQVGRELIDGRGVASDVSVAKAARE